MTSTVPSVPPWAIVYVRLTEPPTELAELRRIGDAMHELAGLVTMEDAVSGVETRDPQTNSAERPELVVYTTPEAAESVARTVEGLAATLDLPLATTVEIRTDDDWRDNWKRFYRPLVFGRNALLLRPSWLPREPGHPDRELVLDPGRAFGTGLHATTQLCLERLCALHEAGVQAPERVLDLGCGSGILALAAARFHAPQRLVAVDVDPEATETTVENAELNAIPIDVLTGDLSAVDSGRFDLVFANIRPEALIPIAADLVRVASPNARVILSGILDDESHNVLAAYEAQGWVLDREYEGGMRRQGIWCAIDLRPPRS